MARSVPYIRTIGDTASWRQDQALNATIYILREIGPTGYLLKEEGEQKKFKVLIGDPHSCTCPVFRKEKEICKHICWILLKKFKVPRHNPVTWQRGLVEREINELLRGLMTRQTVNRRPSRQETPSSDASPAQRPQLEQRPITDEDVCPICQDEFLAKHEPVTFCKYGCGNNVHIKCMKIWAEHQKSIGEADIRCPMCRQDFGPYEVLKQEYYNSSTRTTRAERLNQHLGTTCQKCHISPIQGKCYKCATCAEVHLCQTCFNTDHHRHHSFLFRQKASQRWRDVERGSGAALPQAVVHNLMSRDIGDNDYDLLLQLDEPASTSDIPEAFIKSLPYEKIRSPGCRLLQPGIQCRVCLRGYEMGDFVRRLPCNHRFHVDCIDNWLLHQRPSCPVDGQVVWSPAIEQRQRRLHEQRQRRLSSGSTAAQEQNTTSTRSDMVLESIGLSVGPAPRVRSANEGVLRAVDRQGTVHVLSGGLAMTGNAITPISRPPDWLSVDSRAEPATNHNHLPPSGRSRLVVRPRAPKLALSSLARGTEHQSASLLIGRRASDSSANSRRGRAPINRSRSSSRERPTNTNDHALSEDISALYLGQSPSENNSAVPREKIFRARPPPNKSRLVEANASVRYTAEEDMNLTGYQL